MPHYLLTGAGFSRNWGGWLADEAFEYLLTRAELDTGLRSLLWRFKSTGGFEAALASLQIGYSHQGASSDKERLVALTKALVDMFDAMNKGYYDLAFEPSGHGNKSNLDVCRFLSWFDAIFTLNQDALLELKYIGPSYDTVRSLDTRWQGSYMPYVDFLNKSDVDGLAHPCDFPMVPNLNLALKDRQQPYYKLHGSANWFSGNPDERMLVMGGNKPELIKQFPILARYHAEFAERLSRPGARLMIIGYSFRDEHINQTIVEACKKGLQIFIVDYNGLDVIDTRKDGDKRAAIPVPMTEFTEIIAPSIIGASRRPLLSTLITDKVERDKLYTFFRWMQPNPISAAADADAGP
jgi:hypothetical protein